MTKPVTRKLAVACLLHRADSPFFCAVCGVELVPEDDLEFDHICADVHGGAHHFTNLRPLHKACHKKKTAKDVAANAKVKRLINPKPSKRPLKSSGRKMQSRPFAKRAPFCK